MSGCPVVILHSSCMFQTAVMAGEDGATEGATSLSVSDRVVWLGVLGTRLGTVRWLGELPELRPGTTAGIELVSSPITVPCSVY